MAYKRILLKLSGEALMGDKQFGIDNDRLAQYAEDIKGIVNQQAKDILGKIKSQNKYLNE